MKTTSGQKAFTGLMLTVLFAVTLLTGLFLHTQQHGISPDPSRTLRLAHWIPGTLTIGFALLHIAQFWKMFRGMKLRFRWFWYDTCLILLLTAATFVSGLSILLFSIQLPRIGLWHYVLGLILSLLIALHLIRGIPSYRRLRSVKR